MRRLMIAGWTAAVLLGSAAAQPLDQTAGSPDGARVEAPAMDTGEDTVYLVNRPVVTFRATLLGDSPQERADLAREALGKLTSRAAPPKLTRTAAGDAVRFEADGQTLFFLVAGDVAGPRAGAMLDAAAAEVQRRLQIALQESFEARDLRRIAEGVGYTLSASVLALLLLRLLFAARRRWMSRLAARLQAWQRERRGKGIAAYLDHAHAVGRFLASLVLWALAALVVDGWITFALRQFAYTRPWGERSTSWLLGVLGQFALAIAGAVPGLLTALFVFVMARLVTRANALFMQRVERGELRLGWLDADIAAPTRRLSNFVVWMFALAMAYPYLPGANSDAFKGVTVLAGLMLSLGASSLVGQALSGLSLMYSRALRAGEYVKIGEVEGTVVSVGLFATKVHTGLSEEVSLPSVMIFGQPIRNFSRLVEAGGYVVHTAVTIGYATPWRQVHAMLLEAARRTPGVAQQPPPYVVQTALSDFYVEYRLCARSEARAPQRRVDAMNALHAHIQDVFNENGVQIMSPHYRADPPAPQVVAHGPWFPPRGGDDSAVRPPGA